MKFHLRRHRHILALGIIALLCLSAIGSWLAPDHPLVVWHQWVDHLLALVREVPLFVFVLATALLPLVGMPVVPLYLMAGVVYSPIHGLPVTLLAILVGLALNLVLSHWIAHHLRPLTERLLARFGVALPKLEGLPLWKVVLLVRITPGAPLMIQNYLLALAGVPLGIYLAVSLPVEILICWGYMAAGKSFATGKWEWLLGGIGVVGFSVLAAGLVRDRIRLKNSGD